MLLRLELILFGSKRSAFININNSLYSEMALKFMEHFLWIASAMDTMGENDDEMWDEEDGFFLRYPSPTQWTCYSTETAIHGRTSATLRNNCCGDAVSCAVSRHNSSGSIIHGASP
jgi:hypothetical protein